MAMTKSAWIDAIVRRAQVGGGVVDKLGLAELAKMTVRQLAEVENLLAMANGEQSLTAWSRPAGKG